MFNSICIIGAGAIGGWLGARLSQAGAAVSFLARPNTQQALHNGGLRLRTLGAGADSESVYPVIACSDPKELAATLAARPTVEPSPNASKKSIVYGPGVDLLIIALKAPVLPQVAPLLEILIGDNTVVLTAMNGVPWWFLQGLKSPFAQHRLECVDPGGAIQRAISADRILGGVVHASCSVDEPGRICHRAGNGLIVGEPSGQITPRLTALEQLLEKAQFDVTLSHQIQGDIWYKLWGNMTINPACVLTGVTADKLLSDDLARNFMSAIMLEAAAIGQKLGLPDMGGVEQRHAITAKLGALKPSMVWDVETGKPIELDALVGAVRELGGLTGVATPFTDALMGLTRVFARNKGVYA